MAFDVHQLDTFVLVGAGVKLLATLAVPGVHQRRWLSPLSTGPRP